MGKLVAPVRRVIYKGLAAGDECLLARGVIAPALPRGVITDTGKVAKAFQGGRRFILASYDSQDQLFCLRGKPVGERKEWFFYLTPEQAEFLEALPAPPDKTSAAK